MKNTENSKPTKMTFFEKLLFLREQKRLEKEKNKYEAGHSNRHGIHYRQEGRYLVDTRGTKYVAVQQKKGFRIERAKI